MNLLLLRSEEGAVDGAEVVLEDRRASHLIEVVGVAAGDEIEVGVLGGWIGSAAVLAVEPKEKRLRLRLRLDRRPPARRDLRLVLALPRPKSLTRILQFCASAGLRSVDVINSWRVEKSYWSSPRLHDSAVEQALQLGLEQGRDTVAPEVRTFDRFKPFVEDHLPEISAGSVKLVGDAGGAVACPASITEPVTLVIGPEGGLIPYELERLAEAGFTAVHLGSRALRVEAAVAALVGRVLAL